MSEGRIVGVRPWLPWPFRAWPWWTEPIGAERLAVLRLGLAVILLVDILSSYAPGIIVYFAGDWFGRPDMLAGHADAPRLNWTLLRGLGQPLESALLIAAWVGASAFVLLGLTARLTIDAEKHAEAPGFTGRSLLVWIVCTVLALPGLWARSWSAEDYTLVWLAPLFAWMLATAFVLLGIGTRLRGFDRPGDTRLHWLLGSAWLASTLLLGIGLWLLLRRKDELPMPTWLAELLAPWNDSHAFLIAALVLWVAATGCLLIGFWSRTSAAVVWGLALSFANLNPHIDNAGDSVRGIILFYLMISPCGAAWSVDAWRRRRQDAFAGPVLIHPWPLRLLLIQMVFIYFCNGLYKIVSADWQSGQSLYYVLRDLNLSRFSVHQLPIPYWLTQVATWAVLTWELGFPVWIALPRTRKPALWFGVAFHLGIALTMELGGFVPYIIILYLPLLPWQRWRTRAPAGLPLPEIVPASGKA